MDPIQAKHVGNILKDTHLSDLEKNIKKLDQTERKTLSVALKFLSGPKSISHEESSISQQDVTRLIVDLQKYPSEAAKGLKGFVGLIKRMVRAVADQMYGLLGGISSKDLIEKVTEFKKEAPKNQVRSDQAIHKDQTHTKEKLRELETNVPKKIVLLSVQKEILKHIQEIIDANRKGYSQFISRTNTVLQTIPKIHTHRDIDCEDTVEEFQKDVLEALEWLPKETENGLNKLHKKYESLVKQTQGQIQSYENERTKLIEKSGELSEESSAHRTPEKIQQEIHRLKKSYQEVQRQIQLEQRVELPQIKQNLRAVKNLQTTLKNKGLREYHDQLHSEITLKKEQHMESYSPLLIGILGKLERKSTEDEFNQKSIERALKEAEMELLQEEKKLSDKIDHFYKNVMLDYQRQLRQLEKRSGDNL